MESLNQSPFLFFVMTIIAPVLMPSLKNSFKLKDKSALLLLLAISFILAALYHLTLGNLAIPKLTDINQLPGIIEGMISTGGSLAMLAHTIFKLFLAKSQPDVTPPALE